MDCSGGNCFCPVCLGLGRRIGREGRGAEERGTEGRGREGRGSEGGCNFAVVVVEQFLGTLKLNGSGPACVCVVCVYQISFPMTMSTSMYTLSSLSYQRQKLGDRSENEAHILSHSQAMWSVAWEQV